MDVQAYITSGVLEDYCLGLLSDDESEKVEEIASKYPEVHKEILAFQNSLEQYAESISKYPPARLRHNLLNKLNDLSKEYKLTLNNLPLLSENSDHKSWLALIKPMIPEKLEEDIFTRLLRKDEQALQSIMWIKNEYPDEVHDNLKECFMVLEGECECHIGSTIIKLGPGGFLDIPLHEHHDVKVVKGPVLAIVQRVNVA